MHWTGKVLVDVSTSPVGPPSPPLAPFLAYSPAPLKMAKVESDLYALLVSAGVPERTVGERPAQSAG